MGFIVPIAMALMSYLSSRKAGGLQDQQSEQNLEQQNQELQYQRQRRAQADPALNALIHLSMGMLPAYQQAQPGIANWGGFGAGGAGAARHGAQREPLPDRAPMGCRWARRSDRMRAGRRRRIRTIHY